jgi:hypothetical protein
MRYLGLFCAVLCVCAVGAVMASSAFALPTLLIGPEEGGFTWTGKEIGKVETEIKSGGQIICQSATAEGTVEAKKPLGAYHSDGRDCTLSGNLCTGTGDEMGTILGLGSWHLVYDTLVAGLAGSGVAVLSLGSAVKFECDGSLFKIEVKAGGMTLCLVLNPTALTKTFELHCNRRAGGFGPEETKYDNASGTWVSITPTEASVNGSAFEETIGVGLATIGLPQDTLIMI